MIAIGRAAPRGLVWLADHELECLLACAPWLLFPSWLPALTALAAFALPVLWLVRWRIRGRLTVPTPLDWPILGLLAMVPVAMWASPLPKLSVQRAGALALGASLFYALLNRRGAWGWRWALAYVGPAVALVALVGVDWVTFKLPLLAPLYGVLPRLITGVQRTAGGGFHPNEVAGTLAMCIPLTMAAWLGGTGDEALTGPRWLARPMRSRIVLGLSVAFMIGVALLTQSRTGVLALGVAVWVLVSWRYPALLGFGAAAVAAGAAWLWWSGGKALAWVLSMPGAHTWEARPEIWANALRVLRDYPLTGMGLNAFAPVSRERYLYLIAPQSWDFVHAHNLWLQVGADLGAVGLLSLAACAGIILYVALRLRRADSGRTDWWAAGLLASLAGYAAFGVIDAIALGAKPTLLVWMVAALLMRHRLDLSPAEAVMRRSWSTPMAVAGVSLAVLAVVLWRPLTGVAYADLGRVYLNKGQAEMAQRWLARAVAVTPNSREARYSLGEAYLLAGREQEALLTWRAAGIEAKDLANKGAMLRGEGRLDEAERWIGWALTLDPGLSDASYELGQLRVAQGRPADAVEAFRQALSTDRFAPREPGAADHVAASDVQRALGILLIRQGQPEEAATLFQSMLSADPNDISTHFSLAQALSLTGDYAAAREELLQLWDQLSGDMASADPVATARAKAAVATALTTNANRLGDLADGQRWALTAHQLEPRDPYPYADLAELYINNALYDEAIAECRAYLRLQADPSGSFDYLLGLAYAGKGDHTEAIAHFQAAIDAVPNMAPFRYRLAEELTAAGNVEQAAQELAKARSLGADGPVQLTGHYRLLTD